MNFLNRRGFLKRSLLATAGTMTMPLFLKAFDQNYVQSSNKKLVIIQWSGGNDGLNTVVPYTNDLYYKARPKLALERSKVLKVSNDLGFNPKLSYLRRLYDNAELSVINNVGYPNPNKSHFRSMDIWHTASGSNEYLSTGWLGRYLDQQPNLETLDAHHIVEVDDALSLAVKGHKKRALAMRNTQSLRNLTQSKLIKSIAQHHHGHKHEDNLAYLYQTLSSTMSSADYLHQQAKTTTSKEKYPLKNKLAKDLKQVAELIIAGSSTQVYYLNMGGFDTHNNQKSQQGRLLGQYNDAIKPFIEDLKGSGKWKDTLVMTFSEFGRRVEENGSKGTDHGKANNLFLMGGNLKKSGFYNEGPDLQNLHKGDLQYKVDFREIYATILNKWLQEDSAAVLGAKFNPLSIL